MVVLSVTQHNTHLKKKSAEIKPFLHIHHILFHLKMWTAAAGINLSVTNTFASFLYLISVRYKSLTYLTIFVPSVSRPLIGWWRWRNRQRRLGDDAYVILHNCSSSWPKRTWSKILCVSFQQFGDFRRHFSASLFHSIVCVISNSRRITGERISKTFTL